MAARASGDLNDVGGVVTNAWSSLERVGSSKILYLFWSTSGQPLYAVLRTSGPTDTRLRPTKHNEIRRGFKDLSVKHSKLTEYEI